MKTYNPNMNHSEFVKWLEINFPRINWTVDGGDNKYGGEVYKYEDNLELVGTRLSKYDEDGNRILLVDPSMYEKEEDLVDALCRGGLTHIDMTKLEEVNSKFLSIPLEDVTKPEEDFITERVKGRDLVKFRLNPMYRYIEFEPDQVYIINLHRKIPIIFTITPEK